MTAPRRLVGVPSYRPPPSWRRWWRRRARASLGVTGAAMVWATTVVMSAAKVALRGLAMPGVRVVATALVTLSVNRH